MNDKNFTHIQINISELEVWYIKPEVIAHDRALYYAAHDYKEQGIDPSTTYDREYAYTLNNKNELLDWLKNNMTWQEVKSKSRIDYKQETLDYNKLFSESRTKFTKISA